MGIGDDAALFVPTPGYQTILTCDWFLEGTHFLREKHPADSVGWKCLARALSDVAAMGGKPRCFLLNLALPKTHIGRWFDDFLGGLNRAAHKFACLLVGGDTSRQEKILINVTVIGEVRTGQAVLRSGAKPGDAIFVSGRLGEAELGLRRLRKTKGRVHKSDLRLKKHLYPEPRFALGQWLAKNRLATSMMDLSDGLSTDLHRLCAASRVGARIDATKIPTVKIRGNDILFRTRQSIGQPKNRPRIALDLALNGGDDYELLFTVPKAKLGAIPASFKSTRLTYVGVTSSTKRIVLTDFAGAEALMPSDGWDSFRS
jgi:thiamine-monophosphate kinase